MSGRNLRRLLVVTAASGGIAGGTCGTAAAEVYVPDAKPGRSPVMVVKPKRLHVDPGPDLSQDHGWKVTLSELRWRRWGHARAKARRAKLRFCGSGGDTEHFCSTDRVRVRLSGRTTSACGDEESVRFYNRITILGAKPWMSVPTTFEPLLVC